MTAPEKHEYAAREPVPPAARSIGFGHMLAIWTGANANNGTWYVGGVVAASAFGGAALATLTANPLAYLVMALVGFMGWRTGVSTMALTRPVLGDAGSALPSLLNVIQLMGWNAVNSFIAAISVTYILHFWLGTPAYGQPGDTGPLLLGLGLMALLNVLAIFCGHRSVKVVECLGTVAILGLGLWETALVLRDVSFAEIWAWRPPEDQLLPVGRAVDAMAAFSLGWVPVIADFTRYCRTRSAATVAPVVGANLGLFWFAFVGIVCTIAAAVQTGVYDPNHSDPSSLAARLGLGALAFFIILLASVTTNAINIMGAGISLTNVLPRLRAMPALWGVALASTALSLAPLLSGSLVKTFILFLDGIGMLFGPLFGVLLADFFLLRRPYQAADLTRAGGPRRGLRRGALAAWALAVLGFLLLRQIPAVAESVGCTFPALALAALLTLALARRP